MLTTELPASKLCRKYNRSRDIDGNGRSEEREGGKEGEWDIHTERDTHDRERQTDRGGMHKHGQREVAFFMIR